MIARPSQGTRTSSNVVVVLVTTSSRIMVDKKTIIYREGELYETSQQQVSVKPR
jgi:hypothetical protein